MDRARRFFDAIAGRYERAYAPDARASRARMEGLLAALAERGAQRVASPRPSPLKVLDLGVGTGRELSALLDAGHDVVGLDVSKAMLERCDRRARRIPLVEADFWGPLPFADAS